YATQQAVERGEQVVVGVNRYAEETTVPAASVPDYVALAAGQRERVAAARRRRDRTKVEKALASLRSAAASTERLMPVILDAVRARATVGEISDALRAVWGVYRPA
ncbi:MAG: methylmalonyl-CoA mutase, partial [Gemmatimonadetes bacterium]